MQEYVGLLGTLEEEEEGAAVAMTCILYTAAGDVMRVESTVIISSTLL